MSTEDATKITKIQNQGYLVMVEDANADTFTERYRVYQKIGSHNLKTVILDEDGNAIGAQG